MSKLKTFLVTGVVAVSVIAMVGTSAQAFAWHPEGKIVKKVQNVTQNGQLSDANNEAGAVAAKPGDILNYVITVSNAQTNDDGKNDMTNTVLTDDLPEGVELVSNPSARKINENLGTIKPTKSVTKEYQVKVTAAKNAVITNKACFTGNTEVNDNPQQGCDNAVVKVTVPEAPKPDQPKPEQPTPEVPAPTKGETPSAPTPEALPQTGPASTIAIVAIVTIAGYLVHLKRSARQN